MGRPTARVACPMCSWNRIVQPKGTHAMREHKEITKIPTIFRFGSFPLDGFQLLRWAVSHGRSAPGSGGPTGFEIVDGMTLEQVAKDPKWAWVADAVYNRAKELVERIEHARSNAGGRA